MSFRNSVTIVASPRPRVGKTLLARLLTDFHIHEDRPVAAFDLNAGEGTLAQFLPEHAAVAGIGDVKGQMALFDRLVADDGVPKIVDVGHERFEAFFALAKRLRFAEEAQRRHIAPSVLFMATPDSTSVEAYERLRADADLTVTPVYNELLGAMPHRDRYSFVAADTSPLRVAALTAALRKYIETPPFSFSGGDLANAANIPIDAHIELQRWLRKIYAEFRELDLRVVAGGELAAAVRL